MGARVSTGLHKLDRALQGGFERGELTLMYGEPGAGKTTLALQVVVSGLLQGLHVLYVYTDGVFPYPRLKRLRGFVGADAPMSVAHVVSFDDVKRIVRSIELGSLGGYDIVVFDTFTGPYRSIPIERRDEVVKHNKELCQLTAILKSCSKELGMITLITSRLRSKLLTVEGSLAEEPVASNVLTYWSDNVISMSKMDLPQFRVIGLLKSHGKGLDLEFKARIAEDGLKEVG